MNGAEWYVSTEHTHPSLPITGNIPSKSDNSIRCVGGVHVICSPFSSHSSRVHLVYVPFCLFPSALRSFCLGFGQCHCDCSTVFALAFFSVIFQSSFSILFCPTSLHSAPLASARLKYHKMCGLRERFLLLFVPTALRPLGMAHFSFTALVTQ